jgi:hypothetical protein
MTESNRNRDKMLKIVRDVFPIFMFKISSKNYTFTIKTIINDTYKTCLIFTIFKTYIYIYDLTKCGINGTSSLKKMEKLAQKLPKIKFIKLEDGSEIRLCNNNLIIPMDILYILSTGQSWYNSLGYYSIEHDKNTFTNSQLLTLPIGKLLENCLYKDNSTENKEELLKGISYFSSNPNISTSLLFSKVRGYMKTDSDKCVEKWVWLSKILYIIKKSKIIQYNNILRKRLDDKNSGSFGRSGSYSFSNSSKTQKSVSNKIDSNKTDSN